MTTNSRYILAGGIAEIVMHPPNSTLPDELLARSDSSYAMSLHCEGSSYSEIQSCDNGVYSVVHRLTIVGYIGEDMASGSALEDILREGVVADVALNSGAVIRVGWSEKYGAEAPLRLVSSELYSGEKRLDYPLKSWVWEAKSRSTLI